VSERDDRLLAEKMEALEAANREVCVWSGERAEGLELCVCVADGWRACLCTSESATCTH
jgi:hypothetical protein